MMTSSTRQTDRKKMETSFFIFQMDPIYEIKSQFAFTQT